MPLGVQFLRIQPSNASNMGSIPTQETCPHILKLRVHMLHLKFLHAITKTEHS